MAVFDGAVFDCVPFDVGAPVIPCPDITKTIRTAAGLSHTIKTSGLSKTIRTKDVSKTIKVGTQ